MNLDEIIDKTPDLVQDIQETMKHILESVSKATILVPIDIAKYIYYKARHKTCEQINSNNHGNFCSISKEFYSYLKPVFSRSFCNGNGKPDLSRAKKRDIFHYYFGCNRN